VGRGVTLNMQIYTNCVVGKCLNHRCALCDGGEFVVLAFLCLENQDVVFWVARKLLE
jgi:hypothetical protein